MKKQCFFAQWLGGITPPPFLVVQPLKKLCIICFFPKKSRFFAKGAIIIVFLLTFTTKQIILRVFLPVSIPFSRLPYVLSSKKIVGEGVNYIIVFALDNKAISSLWFSAGLLPFFPLVPLFCSLKQLWSSTIHHSSGSKGDNVSEHVTQSS